MACAQALGLSAYEGWRSLYGEVLSLRRSHGPEQGPAESLLRCLGASQHTLPKCRCVAGSTVAPRVRPMPTMPVSTRGRHLMMMMLVVVLAMGLVMLVMRLVKMLMVMLMVLVDVTMSGIKLRQEPGRTWRNLEWLASHQGSQGWRQSRGEIGTSLPLFRGLGPSGVLRQELWRWRWNGQRFPTHDHLRGRG